MSHKDWRPRLSTELTPDQYTTLSQILPHGMQKPLFQTVVNGIIALYLEGGVQALGAITSEFISIHQLLNIGLTHTRKERIALYEQKLAVLKKGLSDGHD